MAVPSADDIPTPLVELRQHKFPFPPGEDYAIRHWLNSAQTLLDGANEKWKSASRPGGNPRKAEEAYKDLRKVADIRSFQRVVSIVLKHSKYQQMYQNRTEEYATYVHIRSELSKAGDLKNDITSFLEKREAAYESSRGASIASDNMGNGRPSTNANGVVKGRPLASNEAVSSRPPSHRSSSPPPLSRMGHPISPTEDISPPPPKSLQERMAALKSAGMNASTIRPIRNSLPAGPTPPPPLSRQSTGGSSPTLQAPGSPVVPRKPQGLMARTPPGSPGGRIESAGRFEDRLEERRGSAPPIIPSLERARAGTLNGVGSNGVTKEIGGSSTSSMGLAFDMNGNGNGEKLGEEEWKGTTGERFRQGPPIRSPSEFDGQFPSLDDLERKDYAQTWDAPREGPDFTNLLTNTAPPLSSRGPLPSVPRTVDYRSNGAPDSSRPDHRNKIHSTSVVSPSPAPSSPSFSLRPLAPQQRAPQPPPSSTKTYTLPFTSDILPGDLYAYLEMALGEAGNGPRVLMIDVRSREEFDSGRIFGEVVCLEPIVVRPGRSSYDLESSLSLSPPAELEMFSQRHKYDVVVIYDRSSTSIPTAPPHSTASEAQRVLWNLNSAIYEKEFSKSLQRQPMLLRGGWEAWEKKVGEKGIARDGVQPTKPSAKPAEVGSRARADSDSLYETKKANRKVTLVASSPSRNSVDFKTPLSPTTYPQSRSGDYFSPISSYGASTFTPVGPLMSPPLALPTPAAQRPGGQTYDYSLQSSSTRPSYPQPQIHNMPLSPHNTSGSSRGLPTTLLPGGGLPRTRSDFGDLHAQSQQSYSYGNNSPRPSIEYPPLRSPQVNQATRPPPPPIPQSSVSPAPLTRPPAVQPAPIRSNSSFSGFSVSPYSTPNSNSARFIPQINFGEDSIGLTGLKNLGNTCYMNSTVQCLSATIPFARYFKEGSYKRDINGVNPLGTKGALANAVAELIRAIWAQNYLFLSPVTFRENICRWAPQFRGSEQHDAQEFLGFLLDGLHEDLNYIVSKPPPVEMSPEREHDLETLPQQIMSEREWEIYRRRNDSFVVQCFQGQFRNQMKCLTCSKTSTTYNTFMPLSVPIPSGRGSTKVDLQQCIATFVREEILDKEDAWNCPRCKVPRKASKKLTLSRLPPILVIHLKRFSFKGPFSDKSFWLLKIETQVQFPLSGLDLTSFMPPPLFDKRAPALTTAPKGHVYDLYGVTNHYGNLSSGH
ncbi:ubiquitin carboxyl-terminal hydrolase 8, partial [Phenoliferia sp. Uapishka_3]